MIPYCQERDAPSPLDKTLLHPAITPCACMQFTLCLITHILLCLVFAIFGSSSKVLIIVSASTFVRAFLGWAEMPAMIEG